MSLRFAYSWHPYWVCVLVKAGIQIAQYPELVEAIASRDRRSRADWGESSRFAKLSEQQVLEIKDRLECGESPTVIAEDYPVTSYAIQKIKVGDTWKSLAKP